MTRARPRPLASCAAPSVYGRDKIPQNFPRNAKDVISRLLIHTPTGRLGFSWPRDKEGMTAAAREQGDGRVLFPIGHGDLRWGARRL